MITIAALLTACGGGGGDGSAPVTPPVVVVPPVVTPPVADATSLQMTVATSTYTAGSVAGSAYAVLNNARQAYGVGLLSQSNKLDKAAENHAAYVSSRYGALDFANTGHIEDPSKPGFTGASAENRVAFSGYAAATVGEVLTTFISYDGLQSDAGSVAANILMAAPYHRFGLLDGSRDIGIADASARFPGEGGVNHSVVFNLAVAQSAKAQLPAQNWLGIWPQDQATDVLYSFVNESPNPIPSNNGACAGYPVSVQVRNGLVLETTAFTLAEAATGAAVNVQLSTFATDANPSFARANTAYIIPFKPLKLGTKYVVHFVGAVNGSLIDKNWSFTTGSANVKLIYGCNPSL